MANHTENPIWPMPKFYFRASFNYFTIDFSEVSGLDNEAQAIEYRHSGSKLFSTIKMPGLQKFSNVTLKRGSVAQKTAFLDWFNKSKTETGQLYRENVDIQLMDENGQPTMTWTLNNAWPTKITGVDLKSDGNEVAIETLELAFESLVVKNS